MNVAAPLSVWALMNVPGDPGRGAGTMAKLRNGCWFAIVVSMVWGGSISAAWAETDGQQAPPMVEPTDDALAEGEESPSPSEDEARSGYGR